MENKFIHGIDEKAAREYLKEIGVLDKIIESAKKDVFGVNYPTNDGFLIIIAANDEWKSRNNGEKK